VFWLGQLLVILFAIQLQWLPSSGMASLRGNPQGLDLWIDVGRHLILPALTLSFGYLSLTTRLMRSSTIEVLQQDYIRTSRAKGASERTVVLKHAVPNALLPILTSTGYYLGFLLSGSALVETVFAWPGLGRLLYDSLFRRDYPVLMGIFLITSLAAIIGNLLADLAYAKIDPRIRYD
jgi:peptide/nickel transport system permease protein